MELGLSLGDPSKPSGFLTEDGTPNQQRKPIKKTSFDLDFCMGLSLRSPEVGSQEGETKARKTQENDEENDDDDDDDQISEGDMDGTDYNQVGTEKVVQLNLLPLAPVPLQIPSHLHSLPWSSDNGSSENGSSGNVGQQAARILDVNRLPVSAAEEVSSANGVGSPFHMEFGMYRNTGDGNLQLSGGNKRGFEAAGNDVVEGERASSRASDDDENGLNPRKKLRLSKEQSAFLEESFKERNTLNPKQKLELAKQLNLRPRQIEVWFQNRRARTKLKQTEVDCDYLKRCCETLSEENRRLHKELQELRSLKASNPFYAQLPATTLTMCPSCKRVATAPPPPTTTTNTAITVGPCANDSTTNKAIPFPQTRAIIYPFSPTPTLPNRSAAK